MSQPIDPLIPVRPEAAGAVDASPLLPGSMPASVRLDVWERELAATVRSGHPQWELIKPALAAMLRSREPGVRARAATLLGRHSPRCPRTAEDLAFALANERDPDAREAIINAVVDLAADDAGTVAMMELLRSSGLPNGIPESLADYGRDCIAVLIALGPLTPLAVAAGLRDLTDYDPRSMDSWWARRRAVKMLALIDPTARAEAPAWPAVVEHIRAALRSFDYAKCLWAAESIAAMRLSTPAVRATLIDLLEGRCWQSAAAACVALGSLGRWASTALPALMRVARSADRAELIEAVREAIDKVSEGKAQAPAPQPDPDEPEPLGSPELLPDPKDFPNPLPLWVAYFENLATGHDGDDTFEKMVEFLRAADVPAIMGAPDPNGLVSLSVPGFLADVANHAFGEYEDEPFPLIDEAGLDADDEHEPSADWLREFHIEPDELDPTDAGDEDWDEPECADWDDWVFAEAVDHVRRGQVEVLSATEQPNR